MTRPRIKGKPRKSRHTVKASERDNRAAAALVQADVNACVAWLALMPTRSLSTQGVRDWGKQQSWTPGYTEHVISKVREELQRSTTESVEQARARLVAKSEQLLEHVTDYKYGKGSGENAGTEVLLDPTTKEPIRIIDHTAAVAHLRFQADLLLPKEAEKHLHVHTGNEDMSTRSDDELHIIANPKPVEATVRDG